LGLFSTVKPGAMKVATLQAGRPVETGRDDISVLLAHVIATRGASNVVTDESMDYPRDWDSPNPIASDAGHREDGRTICIHSLAVIPDFQGIGLGRTLLTAYIQQISGTGIADRIALIAHEVSSASLHGGNALRISQHLIPYYEHFGFVNKGPSKAQFGGGGWTDMVSPVQNFKVNCC
jgi:GNAT superfamily N-acetyltransferase